MSKALAVYAGKSALAQIKQQGISQQQIKMLVGASGGPKWFVLAGLDRYLCGEFFKDRTNELYTLGSSAGAWRFACYGQDDRLAAINRLISGYSQLCYPKKASISQVSQQSQQLLSEVLGAEGAMQVVANPIIKSTIIVAKSLGLTSFEHKALQLPGLLSSAVANRFKRQYLNKFYQRMVFTNDSNQHSFAYDDGITSKVIALTAQNYQASLQATGAIPLIINGVKDIAGAGPGMYRDGGIIDYHFDQPFLPHRQASDLVLYPHFQNEFKPGWFDKYINNRYSAKQHFDNVVVLAPSQEFVRSLPYAKIPERTDFTEMSDSQRLKYWHLVISESYRLADEFADLVASNNPAEHIQLI